MIAVLEDDELAREQIEDALVDGDVPFERGTAQAALSIKAPEVGAAIEIPAIHPVWIGERSAFLPAARLSFLMADHPPPSDGRDTHLRISLLRI